MATRSREARPIPAPEVSAFPLDDALVLFDARNNQSYMLNTTAARVWALLDGTRSVGLVAHDLAKAYGIREQQALNDVRELLDGMLEASVVRVG
jgi:hypothetical protein